jgi:hypothetical protein
LFGRVIIRDHPEQTQTERRKDMKMSPNVNSSMRKPARLAYIVYLALAGLALVLTVSPGSAASPQPQSQSQSPQPPQPPQSPNATCPSGGQCFADVPPGTTFYTFTNRLYQQDLVNGYPCGGPGEPCDQYNRPYYRPTNDVNRQQMAKFIDNARRLPQIHIETSSTSPLIYATNDSGPGVWGTSTSSYGVYGQSSSGYGVRGYSSSGYGVYGSSPGVSGVTGGSTSGNGVQGYSSSGTGVSGISTSSNGVYGSSGSGYGVEGFSNTGQAGHFSGNVQVTGNLSKGGGSFKIDHPLDPQNKYLYHSFVESPDMMDVYNGNATLDAKGEAWVQMPDWFSALNRDFRYQLTPIGSPGPNLYIAQEIKDNRFKIGGGQAGMKVSWMVTGIRQDPYANAHRIPVEEDKPANEKGKYLHPTEWGQLESKGIDYEQRQTMQQIQQATESKP